MKLQDFLFELKNISKENELSEPFIVGGYVRDKLFGLPLSDVADIDITTGDSNSNALAIAASKKWPTAHYRLYDDGHASLQFKNIKVDFSNNFNLPDINKVLLKKGIENPTNLQKEMFSRDFTINCLLQPLDLSKGIIDVIGVGKEDIVAKILKTPVDPMLTIGHDPRRILRGLKLSLRFNLKIDKALEDAMKYFKDKVSSLPFSTIKKQINQMLKIDSKNAIELLSEYGLLPIIPISKQLGVELAKNHMVQHILDGEVK
jgi:tRNA nucleotidyltransferase/poly(A) polymerase